MHLLLEQCWTWDPPTNNCFGWGDAGETAETGRDRNNIHNLLNMVRVDGSNVCTYDWNAYRHILFLKIKTPKTTYYKFGLHIRLLSDDCFKIRLLLRSFVYKNQDYWGTTAEVIILLYFDNVYKGKNQPKNGQAVFKSVGIASLSTTTIGDVMVLMGRTCTLMIMTFIVILS